MVCVQLLSEKREGQQQLQTVSGERVFIMPAVFYKAIFEALQSVAGAAARSLMYYIGVKAGRAMAKDALRVRSGTENIDSVRAIAEILEAMGVGKLESVEKAGSAVKLVLSNTLSGALGIDGGEGCHLERGLVAGMMSEMIGKRVVVKQAQGEKGKCVFEVEVTG